MLSRLRTIIALLLISFSLPALAQELKAMRDVEIKESTPSKYLLETGDTLGVVRKNDIVTQLERKIVKTMINQYVWLRIQYKNPRTGKTVTGWVYSGKEGEQQYFRPIN